MAKNDEPPHFTGEAVAAARGAVEIATAPDKWQPIALEFPCGEGSVTLVSDARPFENKWIDHADNAVFVYHVAAGDGARPVVLDEFYHGVLERGLLALVGTYPYNFIALFVVAATLIWAWSLVVRFGPTVPDAVPSRRSILDYIEAMAHLFWRGRKLAFALQTCRSGYLDDLRTELHLPAGSAEPMVLQRLAQSDAQAAERLQAALQDVDLVLAAPYHLSLKRLSELQERLELCRSSKRPKPRPPLQTASSPFTPAQ